MTERGKDGSPSRLLDLSPHDQRRLRSALRRGRHPLLCWDDTNIWLIVRPRSHEEARELKALQQRRGIRSVFVHETGDEE